MIKSNLLGATFVATLLLMGSTSALSAAAQPISDTVITTKVKAKLLSDYSNIKVTTNKGIVILTGTVNSNTDADAVVEKVQATDGVKNINTDNFYINGSQHFLQDGRITAEAKGLFMRARLLKEKDINPWISVETTNGIVYLSGTAKSQQQINHAVALARSIDGVKDVNTTQLKISK
jgi:hyperosmotically inducible protein